LDYVDDFVGENFPDWIVNDENPGGALFLVRGTEPLSLAEVTSIGAFGLVHPWPQTRQLAWLIAEDS